MSRELELKRELDEIREEKHEQELEVKRQENYEYFKDRPDVYMIGKAYVKPMHAMAHDTSSGMVELNISISIPGNVGSTYTVSNAIPSAVRTYLHNIMTNDVRQKIQSGIDNVVKEVIEETANTPQSVLEMMGLQSNYYFLQRTNHFPKDKIVEIEAEINDEAFKVLDKFTEQEFIDCPQRYHSSGILMKYAESRGLKKLIAKTKRS